MSTLEDSDLRICRIHVASPCHPIIHIYLARCGRSPKTTPRPCSGNGNGRRPCSLCAINQRRGPPSWEWDSQTPSTPRDYAFLFVAEFVGLHVSSETRASDLNAAARSTNLAHPIYGQGDRRRFLPRSGGLHELILNVIPRAPPPKTATEQIGEGVCSFVSPSKKDSNEVIQCNPNQKSNFSQISVLFSCTEQNIGKIL